MDVLQRRTSSREGFPRDSVAVGFKEAGDNRTGVNPSIHSSEKQAESINKAVDQSHLVPAQERKDMDRGGEPSDTRYMSLFYGLATGVSVLLIVLVTTWVFYYRGGLAWQEHPELQFNWHPILMITSMVVFFGHSVVIYRVLRQKPKKKLKLMHGGFLIATLIIASVGLKAVFDSHTYAKPEPIPHLYTLHSWLGLSTAILFGMQWVSGFVSFLFPGLRHSIRASYLPLHVYGGMMIFVTACATSLLGLLEKAIFAKAYPHEAEGVLMNCIGILVLIFASLISYIIARWQYKRQPLPEDELLLSDKFAD